MNRDWHLAHPMPPRATEAERIAWHLEHAAHCRCREIPARLRERMRALGIEPSPASPPSAVAPAGGAARPGTPTTRRPRA